MNTIEEFIYVLKLLFGHTSVVLIGGTWKTGKTDFGLLIAEILQKKRIIKNVASNIDTKDHLTLITDLYNLKRWLKETRGRKLYIFDEGSVHLRRRRSMSTKNVEIIQAIPELSKGRACLIIIGHNLQELDKTFGDQTWLRGVFIKIPPGKKKVQLTSDLLPNPYEFRDIPKTSIPFDPYLIAPFTLKPDKEIMFKDEELRKAWTWVDGGTWKELFDHPNQCNRFVRRVMKRLLLAHSQIHVSS